MKLPLVKKLAIESILVYSSSAAPRAPHDAKALAKYTGGRLKLVDVLEPLPSHVAMWLPQSPDVFAVAREAQRSHLQKKAERLHKEGVKTEWQLLEGQPETALVQEIKKYGHDLLMIDTPRTPDEKLTTRAMRLLRKCPCPVWVEGAKPLRGTRRILAALDAIPGDDRRAELNDRIAALAKTLAKAGGAELHVVNAWEAYGEGLLRSHMGATPADVRRYTDEVQRSHREEIAAALRRARLVLPETRVHLVKGQASEAIPALARRLKVNLVVLGTVARSGLSAALIGNTAETIAGSLTCSMLAVKPDPTTHR